MGLEVGLVRGYGSEVAIRVCGYLSRRDLVGDVREELRAPAGSMAFLTVQEVATAEPNRVVLSTCAFTGATSLLSLPW